VSYGVWKIPEASITMFPDVRMQRFGAEDRVPVALFYLDEYIEPEKPTWRLLFEGEITGWSYTNSAGGRALSFDCIMNIALWTQLFIFYMTSLSSVATAVVATGEDAASIAQAHAVPGFSLLRQGLLNAGQKIGQGGVDDYVKRPYDFVYNAVRSLTATEIPQQQRCIPGTNFFARWSRREQFHNRWVAIPFLEEPTTEVDGKEIVDKEVPGVFPVLRAAKSLAAVQAVENNIADKYSGGSIYTIMKQVLDTVLMELAMLPTAPCVTTRFDGVIQGPPVFRTSAEQLALVTQQELTEARKQLLAARDIATTDEATVARLLKTAGMPYDFGGITSALLDTAIKRIDEKMSVTADTGPKDAALPVRLGNYFVKPQMLFGLPPNCNVIFPSMTPQISYQENYITQPTRLYLNDDSLMQLSGFARQDADIKNIASAAISRAYPPEADKKWQAHLKGDGAASGKNLLVWPEEFFKGPVTARYPAPPWLIFLASQYQVEGLKAGTPTGTVDNKSTKADATQANDHSEGALSDQDVYALYAQYEYFRHRFAQRNGAVTCAFQPYVVPGLPVAIFDDFQSQLHLIGYMMNATQQFTSRTVSTSFNFGYGRTLYEFLDLLAHEIDTGGAVAGRKDLAMAAAPAEPIKEIRDVIQHFHKAEQFYQALLHQRKTTRAVFEYRDLIAFVDGKGGIENIMIEGLNEETLAAKKTELADAIKVLDAFNKDPARFQSRAPDDKKDESIRAAISLALGGTSSSYTNDFSNDLLLEVAIDKLRNREQQLTKHTVQHNLSDVLSKTIVPKPGAEPYFDSYDAAMQYCARPICTLEEYIGFIRGVREGVHDDVSYPGGTAGSSARYYTRIRKLIGAAPNFAGPTPEQRGMEGSPKAINPKDEPGFPVMRAEWDKVLLQYRQSVYSTVEIQR
jgi:hypothetical protein